MTLPRPCSLDITSTEWQHSLLVISVHRGAILEIETMQELINADSNGNSKTIRACYGQCGFGSVLRGGGQGITGVMEETEPKIVGYTRDSKGKVVKRSLRDTGNTVTTFTGSGCTTDMYVAEPRISASRGRGEFKIQKYIKENPMKNEKSNIKDSSKSLSSNTELRMEDGCMVDKEGRKYRIRKLTPTECFRLQDVSDEDIEKIRSYRDDETAVICDANGEPIMNMDFDKPSKNARKITITVNGEQREYYSSQLIWKNKGKGISKTAQYKLAGNSICVACMFHISASYSLKRSVRINN